MSRYSFINLFCISYFVLFSSVFVSVNRYFLFAILFALCNFFTLGNAFQTNYGYFEYVNTLNCYLIDLKQIIINTLLQSNIISTLFSLHMSKYVASETYVVIHNDPNCVLNHINQCYEIYNCICSSLDNVIFQLP